MSLALDSVALGVSDDDEATTRLVAEKIIEAGHGMRGATLRATVQTGRGKSSKSVAIVI